MRKLVVLLSASALAGVLGCAAEEVGDPEPIEDGVLAAKAGAHFVGDPTCVESGDSLTCSGSVAGLGNRAVTVNVNVTRICTNRGGNDPPGQVSGSSGPVQPENGRIDFSVTVSDDCPDKMASTFLSPATITIFQGNTEVFSGQISF
jgi:hypothetical protein